MELQKEKEFIIIPMVTDTKDNGNKIKSKTDLYSNIKHQLKLPSPMGHNLDALWDSLSHRKSIKKITIIHADHLSIILGKYSESLIQLFKDLSEKNEIELIIYSGKRNESQ